MIHKNKIDEIMKKQIKAIIIAVIFGTFSINAQASEGVKNASTFLSVNNTEVLAKFVNKKGKKIAKRYNINLVDYLKVVDLYYTSPSEFYNLSQDQKQKFTNSSVLLNKKFNTMRGDETKDWANKIDLYNSVFEIIWNAQSGIVIPEGVSDVPSTTNTVTTL